MKGIFAICAMVFASSMLVYSDESKASDRASYFASVLTRGTTVVIPEATVKKLCGDFDGCTLRMGMYNWDGTGRTASRDSLFYYNSSNRNWRASRGDKAGANLNVATQHVMNAWACYFTDGRYAGFANYGDFNTNFGLLSWNQYSASCKLTIID